MEGFKEEIFPGSKENVNYKGQERPNVGSLSEGGRVRLAVA